MSAILKAGFSFAQNFIKPSFYAAHWNDLIVATHKDLRAGSAVPMFKGMVLVGIVGYTVEYVTIGSKIIFRTVK